MTELLKKSFNRVIKGQGGFTLIEMIVVVGIIAVLAAVIVPNIGKFIGTGESGAMKAEQGSVETAMKAMMAENQATLLDVSVNSTASWTLLPTGDANTKTLFGAAPGNYLQNASTNYAYCWDAQGTITHQDKVPSTGTC